MSFEGMERRKTLRQRVRAYFDAWQKFEPPEECEECGEVHGRSEEELNALIRNANRARELDALADKRLLASLAALHGLVGANGSWWGPTIGDSYSVDQKELRAKLVEEALDIGRLFASEWEKQESKIRKEEGFG